MDPEDNNIANSENAIKVKFSLAYIVHKIKRVWPILDFFAKHVFTIISITMMLLSIYWKLSVINSIFLLILIIFYALVPFKFQPSRPILRVQDNEKLTLDDIKKLWSHENHDVNSRLISLKYKIVMILIIFTIICMSLLHLSANLQGLRETYSDKYVTWENIIYVTFFFGINYNEQKEGDSYFYEMYGYIIILALCILERKSQIWLTSRFGYIGSKYDIQDAKLVLQMKEIKNRNLKRNSTQNSKVKEISFEIQDIKFERGSTLYADSQDLNEAFVNHTKSDLVDDYKYTNTENNLQKEFDSKRTNRIRDVIKLNVLVRIYKGFRVFLYTIIILLSMLAAIDKCNLFSIIMMIAVIFMTFGKLTYFNLKWFSLFIMFVLFIQYISALANLSPWNSPSAIPIPFNNTTMKSPIGVPLYKELKKPFTKV